jgi:hypothetical protein
MLGRNGKVGLQSRSARDGEFMLQDRGSVSKPFMEADE